MVLLRGAGENGVIGCSTRDLTTGKITGVTIQNKNNGTTGLPAVAVYDNKIYCVHEGAGKSGAGFGNRRRVSKSGNDALRTVTSMAMTPVCGQRDNAPLMPHEPMLPESVQTGIFRGWTFRCAVRIAEAMDRLGYQTPLTG